MKKLLAKIALVATLVAPLAVPLTASAAVLPNWDLTGQWVFDDIYQSVHYLHTMNITSFDPVTGAFSGTGFYNAAPSLTWTVSGVVSGNDVSVFNLLVLTDAPGVVLSGSGTINSSGTFITGTGTQTNLLNNGPVDWTAAGAAESINQTPGDKAQCKNGGYKNFIDPQTGVAFKNQGQCVSYTNHL